MQTALKSKFESFGSQVAIIDNEVSYHYHDVISSIDSFTALLNEKGIGQGDVVILFGDYSFHSITMFLALTFHKNIIVPLASTHQSEIDEKVGEIDPNWTINVTGPSPVIAPCDPKAERHQFLNKIAAANHAGLVLFSSGSTGKPKTMVHDLDNLVAASIDKRPKKLSFIVFLMFDHIGGINTLLNCISMGSTMIIPKDRSPDHVAALIEKFKVNILPSSPTFLNLLLIGKSHEKFDLSSLRMITYGTEPMPDSLLTRLKSNFGRVKFLQTFGTSETGIASTNSKSSSSTFLKIDDPNQEYRIVNKELWLRSKTQILGYLNHDNDAFTEDGWFKTGDLVEQTDDGFIKIIGRAKEVINVGGEKVIPSEVESVLMDLDIITDCVVYGKPNPIVGQMVVAEVSLNQEMKLKEVKAIVKEHCNKRLESYKVPVKIIPVQKLDFSSRFKKSRLK